MCHRGHHEAPNSSDETGALETLQRVQRKHVDWNSLKRLHQHMVTQLINLVVCSLTVRCILFIHRSRRNHLLILNHSRGIVPKQILPTLSLQKDTKKMIRPLLPTRGFSRTCRSISTGNRRNKTKIQNEWLHTHTNYDRKRHADVNRSTGGIFFVLSTAAAGVSIFIMGKG